MKVWLKACESRNRLFTSRNGTVWILYGVATRRKYRGRDGTQTPLWWGSWWCLYSINCKKKDIQYLIRKFLKQTNHFSVKEAKIKEDKQQLEGKTTQQLHMHQDNLKKGKKSFKSGPLGVRILQANSYVPLRAIMQIHIPSSTWAGVQKLQIGH